MVRAVTREVDLLPVVRLDTHRTVHRLVDVTGQVLDEPADDHVTAERLPSRAPLATSAGRGLLTSRTVADRRVGSPRSPVSRSRPGRAATRALRQTR